MGNLFESESDPSGKRNSSSNINEKSLFSSSELIQIESTRQKMIHPENKALFPSKLLFCAMETHSILSTPVNFEVFIGTCTRSNKSTTLRCVWDLLYDSTNPQKSLQLQLYQLLTVLLELCGTNQSNLPSLITRLSNSIHRINNNGSVDNGSTEDHATITSNDQEYELLQQWTRQYGAHLPNVFETFFDSLCFGISHGSSLTRFSPPALSIPSEIVSVDELLPLALFHSMLQGAWKRLYSSSSDGLSFNRIAHHIIGYESSTCLLIKCSGMNAVIGSFTQDGWRDSNRAHGSSSNCLFSLSPEFKIIRSRDNSVGAFQWLNTATYGAPHGLAFGGSSIKGDAETFRLFIPDSLENCVIRFSCLTYESGDLFDGATISPSSSTLSSSSSTLHEPQKLASNHEKNFEIECLEVWACGGDEALTKGFQSQTEARKIKQNTIDKARKVDKAQFFGNAFDREFFLSSTINQHGTSQTGNDR